MSKVADFLARRSTPSVRQLAPVRLSWAPVTISICGEVGKTERVALSTYSPFRPSELFAQDTSSKPGRMTAITNIVVGQRRVLPQHATSLSTWMFYEWLAPEDRGVYETLAKLVGTFAETPEARHAAAVLKLSAAAMKMDWPSCNAGMTIEFAVYFEETCRWDGVLWGHLLS